MNRDLYSLQVPTAQELPETIRLSSDHFVCLLTWDSGGEIADTILRAAGIILDSGCAYLCSWGAGCERVHDVFDDVIVGSNTDPDNDSTIMTTWHEDDSLDDALWYFLNATWPDDRYSETCRAAIAVSIAGSDVWHERIGLALSSPRQFGREGEET